jgi:hypothetical protein
VFERYRKIRRRQRAYVELPAEVQTQALTEKIA